MAEKGSRLAYLLGEMRRMMNGAVVGSMRFYGAEYGLNYGVSLSTIRSLARAEREGEYSVAENHKFARLLYQQEVRELRLAALWLADPEIVIQNNELSFWAKGIINSEVAEEVAFALTSRCSGVEEWLFGDETLLQYCAIMSLAKGLESDHAGALGLLNRLFERFVQLVESEPHIIPKAVVALLDSALKVGVESASIEQFLAELPLDSAASNYIREEMAWRIEFR